MSDSELERILARRTGLDERDGDIGPPTGTADRRVAHQAATSLEIAEQRITPASKIIVSIAAVIGLLATWGWVANPLETKAQASEQHASLNRRIDEKEQHDAEQDRSIAEVRNRLDNIDRNQSKTLNLQQRQVKRGLCADLRSMPPGSPGRANLERQLDEVSADLGERGSCE